MKKKVNLREALYANLEYMCVQCTWVVNLYYTPVYSKSACVSFVLVGRVWPKINCKIYYTPVNSKSAYVRFVLVGRVWPRATVNSKGVARVCAD